MASPTHTQPAVVRADADKRALKTTILELRRLLEADLGKQLRRLGIDGARTAPVAASTLSYLAPDEVEARTVLDGVLAKERLAVSSYAAAVEAVLREAVYTHLNRLVGLKCLELRRHLVIDGETTEAVTCRPEFGGRSKWLWTLRDRHPEYRHGEDAEERLWREGLTLACAAVSEQIRILFDPADPYAQVWPSYRALRDTVDALNRLPEDVFRADETLGWVYQYFQTDEKARVLEEERTKKKKTGWPDIIPRTSLYTERYMVDFLLQNSLGALWMEMYPDSTLAASWPYYVKPATPYTREPKPVRQWRLLDPAEGSGHFLVVAFDLFRQLYAEERRLAAEGKVAADWVVPEEEVAATILSQNLHGIDIDPRSVQISALALWLKAREAGLSAPPRLNLVVADCVLGEGEAYEQLLAKHADRPLIQEAIRTIWRSLQNVRELGSLIRVEEELADAVQEVIKRERRHRPLFEAGTDWGSFRLELLADLRETFKAEAQTQDVGHRLFGAEGEKGLDLVEALSARYDVVCTNPPYMNSKTMSEPLKGFIASWYPAGKRDLFAAFILRARSLLLGRGYLALVTQQSWMFHSSFEGLRRGSTRSHEDGSGSGLVQSTSLTCIAHIGPGGFGEISGDVVSVALFVARNTAPRPDHRIAALRLTDVDGLGKKAALLRSQSDQSRVRFTPRNASLLSIPGSPIVYWLPESVLTMLSDSRLLGEQYEIREGPCTGNDAQWLRFFWEIRDHEEWRSFPKGGGYCKWSGLDFYTIRWGADGRQIKDYPRSIIPNESWYFTAGLTYTEAANGAFGVRRLNATQIPGNKAPGLLPIAESIPVSASLLNCRVVSYLARALAAGFHFSIGPLRRVPIPEIDQSLRDRLLQLGAFCIDQKSQLTRQVPTEREFERLPGECAYPGALCFSALVSAYPREGHLAILHAAEGAIERLVFGAYGFNQADTEAILGAVGSPAGWYPLVDGYESLSLDGVPPGVSAIVSEEVETIKRVSPSAELLGRVRAAFSRMNQGADGSESADTVETEEDAEPLSGDFLPIPAETVLEALSHRVAVHPVSADLLLRELRRDEGLVCPPELKRHTEDYFSVKLLRMLGHRWPMQDHHEKEEGRPFIDPAWVDEDGIIPLTAGTGEETLAERFSRFLDVEFGADRGHAVELEAGQILGWKPGDEWGKQTPTTIARWLERDFFKRHVSQFKKRPIAWHLSSPRGTFQVIAYYHKLDRNRLQLLRSRYVRHCLDDLHRQLAAAQAATPDRQTLARIADLETRVADVEAFEAALGRLLEGRDREARIWCPWKKPEEQPVGWDPDVNDGVRVNVAPVQRLGLLAADVLAKKDLASLLAPEGRR